LIDVPDPQLALELDPLLDQRADRVRQRRALVRLKCKVQDAARITGGDLAEQVVASLRGADKRLAGGLRLRTAEQTLA